MTWREIYEIDEMPYLFEDYMRLSNAGKILKNGFDTLKIVKYFLLIMFFEYFLTFCDKVYKGLQNIKWSPEERLKINGLNAA